MTPTPAERKAARIKFRGRVSGALSCFNMYGLDVFVPGAIHAIIEASEEFAEEINGGDQCQCQKNSS